METITMRRETRADLDTTVKMLRAQINQDRLIYEARGAELRVAKEEIDRLRKDVQWLRLAIQSHLEILQRSIIKER
jgi:hypothetical protein